MYKIKPAFVILALLVGAIVYNAATNGKLLKLLSSIQAEHFSQTMLEVLSPFGSYRGSKLSDTQSQRFGECIQFCDDKARSCLSNGNPTTCMYNYKVCRQDCGWTARVHTR